jgi:hypothetical protein
MQHHFQILEFYPGLEDGYIDRMKCNLKARSPLNCNSMLLPFIYNEVGEKQIITECDVVEVQDNVKIVRRRIEINHKVTYNETNKTNRNTKTRCSV